MNRHWFSTHAFKLLISILLISLIFSPGLTGYGTKEVHAGERAVHSAPPPNTGPILIVTNTNMEENGSYWDPYLLIANPGPDGISYAEAIHAVGADNGLCETITFDPALSGAIIDTSQGHNNAVTADCFSIDGDLDDDGDPDVTLDGNNAGGNGIWLWAPSHVLIEGLILRNHAWGGIRLTNNVEDQNLNIFEDIIIRNNRITGTGYKGAIEIVLENVDYGSIKNIEIIGNTILDDSLGVNIEAGWGGNSYNEISQISIISNTITGGVIIHAGGGFSDGCSHNTISDVVIQGNQISGDPIWLAGSNRGNGYDNTLQDVVVANNQIDASPVAIKISGVTENGGESHDNLVQNIIFTDNVLNGGGFHIGGGLAVASYNNKLSGLVIDRNYIKSSAAGGIYMVAGDNGAHHNLIENTIIRNSLVAFCSDAGVLIHGEDISSPYNAIQGVTLNNLTLVNNAIGSFYAGGININSLYPGNIISGVTISNTILWENNFADAILGSETPDSVAYSILNDVRFTGSNGNFYESPVFVDPHMWDYSLQPGSPGVDTGDPSALNIGALDLDRMMRVWDGDQDDIAIVDRGAWEYGAIQPQEIDVQGNLYSIRNGDTVPGYWDDTDFGIASLSGETVEHTFTLRNTGDLTLTLIGEPMVAISGTHTADFSVTIQPQSSVAAGGSTTFSVTFDPGEQGLREAILTIPNDDPDEDPYIFAIEGTGIIVNEPNNIFFPIIER